MKRLLLWLPLAVFVAFLATVAIGLRKPADTEIRSTMIGKPMPDFALEPAVAGVVRGVETLGAWAGASLLAHLRVKGVVEIERDRFLAHGLGGASLAKEVSVVEREGVGRARSGLGAGGKGDRASWTLGVWA